MLFSRFGVTGGLLLRQRIDIFPKPDGHNMVMPEKVSFARILENCQQIDYNIRLHTHEQQLSPRFNGRRMRLRVIGLRCRIIVHISYLLGLCALSEWGQNRNETKQPPRRMPKHAIRTLSKPIKRPHKFSHFFKISPLWIRCYS